MARSVPTDKQSIVRAVQCGYCDFILRPTEPDILKEKIERIFSTSTKVDMTTFALPISMKGSIAADIDITGISEFGVEGISHVPVNPKAILKLNSDFLTQFELSGTHFRVTGCEEDRSNGELKHRVALTYVALSSKSATLIRQYLIRQAGRVLKAA